MEKIVNKKINIFNDNCYDNKSNRKFAKITFILCSLLCFMNIQSSIAQNSNKLVVPVKCVRNGEESWLSEVALNLCIRLCQNLFRVQGSGFGNSLWFSYNAMTGRVLAGTNEEVAYDKCKNECKQFCPYDYVVEIDTVKFLEAMPEIGTSRIDPNFIEYE